MEAYWLNPSQSLFLCSDVYICYACQRALKSLLEWMAQIWSSVLTNRADAHTFHAGAQHRPLVPVPRTVRARRMQWKGPVASTGGPVLLCIHDRIHAHGVLSVLHSCLELPRLASPSWRLGRTRGWPCAPLCCPHGRGPVTSGNPYESRCQRREGRWQKTALRGWILQFLP